MAPVSRAILLLRISYWTAAVADFVIAILVLIPERMGVGETVYPMGLASAIAFSWGVLLITAARRPLERKWVLLPTMLVVSLIALTRTVFSIYGDIKFSLTLLLFAIALVALMGYSYFYAMRYIKSD